VTPLDGEKLMWQLPQQGLKMKALFTFAPLGPEAHWASLFTIVINNLCN
jgi:hypothetical protein